MRVTRVLEIRPSFRIRDTIWFKSFGTTKLVYDNIGTLRVRLGIFDGGIDEIGMLAVITKWTNDNGIMEPKILSFHSHWVGVQFHRESDAVLAFLYFAGAQ